MCEVLVAGIVIVIVNAIVIVIVITIAIVIVDQGCVGRLIILDSSVLHGCMLCC